MTTRCSCGATTCGLLPPADASVSEALQLLLRLGLNSNNETSLPVSPESAGAVDALLADAVAAASSAVSDVTAELKSKEKSNFNRQWLLGIWQAHIRQHVDLQACYLYIQSSNCRAQQLTTLQALTSSLMQAAESLVARASVIAAAAGEHATAEAATVAHQKGPARTRTAAQTAAATRGAAQKAGAGKKGERGSMGSSGESPIVNAAKQPKGSAAPAPATIALGVLYGQLCCWLLHQLQLQQLQLLMLQQQSSGAEGRLQRLCRLLSRVLATVRPLCLHPVTDGSHTAASCPSALLCRCWWELAEEAPQQQGHSRREQGFDTRVSHCFARRFLQGIAPATAANAPVAAAAAATTAATAAGISTAACLLKLAAFAAAEIPCAALLDSIKQQQQQQDLLLLEVPLRLCVSTLLNCSTTGTTSAGTAAECLSWALSSLGDCAWGLPCMQHLLSVGLWQQNHQQEGVLWRLLQLLSQDTSAAFPLASLFVQLVLERGPYQQGPPPAWGAPLSQPHACWSLLISLLLGLLTQQGEQQKRAAALLMQCMHPAAAAAAAAAAACESFARLSPAARAALLRALLLQQHAAAAGGSDSRRKQQQQQQQQHQKEDQQLQKGGPGSEPCCTYTSPEGQQQLQLLLLRSVLALRKGDTAGDECSTLLLLHLWLQQAPQTPLLQVLQQQQQLQLVADAAMRYWQHPRRAVHSAARGVWALLQQRCSEGVSAAAAASSSSNDSSTSSGSSPHVSLVVALCKRLFGLPAASRKALYQALASLVHALGAPRVLQLQPLLLPHLLSQLQNRPLRSAAMLVLRALCEELSEGDKQQQKENSNNKQQRGQQRQDQGATYVPSRGLRTFLLGPLRNALTGYSTATAASIAAQQQQQGRQGSREYPLLLPFEVPAASDSPPAEALAETVLPLLLRFEPSAAAPLLVALSSQVALEEAEAAAEARARGAGPESEGNGLPLFSYASEAPTDAWKPWSAGEAALLAAARAAGLAAWEAPDGPQQGGGGARCCSNPSNSNCGCIGNDTGACGAPCLVVRGCTFTGIPVCYRVSPQRLRRGLSSGDKYLRLRLLEALTLHPQTTAPPRCEELQLLLYAAKQQLRLGSAAERSQFVAAFERVLIRGRNANRVTLAGSNAAILKDLADKGCCCCKDHREGTACGGGLGCLLRFLRRLHTTCILACYAEAPPDRVMVALAILVSVHSLWGRWECSQQHRKKSTVAQAAAAESSKGGLRGTQMQTKAANAANGDDARISCVVAEALGWHDWVVRSQLLALLPVVAGPAPRSLVTRLLQQLPAQMVAPSVALEEGRRQQQQQQQQPSGIDPAERISRSAWDACEMLTSLRQDECAAGAVHLQLLLHELFISPLECLSDKQQRQQQPDAAAAAAASALGDNVLHLQAVFCSNLEEALRRQLPSTLPGIEANEAPAAGAPTETAEKALSRINQSSCPFHPARGLLDALNVMTQAAEVRLAAVHADPMVIAEPRMGLHGILGALELALAAISPRILLLPCGSTRTSSSSCCCCGAGNRRACSSAACAWSDWQRRFLLLLQNTCQYMTSFTAAGDDEETEVVGLLEADPDAPASAADAGSPKESRGEAGFATKGSDSAGRSPQRRQLQVDCRGHPLLSREDGVDHEERQQLLAFCSWRAIKGATECLVAFWKAAALDESSGAVEGGDRAPAPAAAASEDVLLRQEIPAGHLQQQQQQQPLMRLTVGELTVLGTSLIKFLLSCRHMGKRTKSAPFCGGHLPSDVEYGVSEPGQLRRSFFLACTACVALNAWRRRSRGVSVRCPCCSLPPRAPGRNSRSARPQQTLGRLHSCPVAPEPLVGWLLRRAACTAAAPAAAGGNNCMHQQRSKRLRASECCRLSTSSRSAPVGLRRRRSAAATTPKKQEPGISDDRRPWT